MQTSSESVKNLRKQFENKAKEAALPQVSVPRTVKRLAAPGLPAVPAGAPAGLPQRPVSNAVSNTVSSPVSSSSSSSHAQAVAPRQTATQAAFEENKVKAETTTTQETLDTLTTEQLVALLDVVKSEMLTVSETAAELQIQCRQQANALATDAKTQAELAKCQQWFNDPQKIQELGDQAKLNMVSAMVTKSYVLAAASPAAKPAILPLKDAKDKKNARDLAGAVPVMATSAQTPAQSNAAAALFANMRRINKAGYLGSPTSGNR